MSDFGSPARTHQLPRRGANQERARVGLEFSYSHQASGQTDAGWVTLFDGKNLDNWSQIGDANWKLADGVVVADKGNGFLVSKDTYTDFQLRAEFRAALPTK